MIVPPGAARIDATVTAAVEVRLLGDAVLREVARPVEEFGTRELRRECEALVATLEQFRSAHGFGRGIAAPQIGISRRIVALHLEGYPFVIINPIITFRSPETFTLWDDCMSFPWLMVKVRRHGSISIEFQDPSGATHTAPDLDPATSELLQHEIDHLDGVLALDRAIDARSVVAREIYEKEKARFNAEVDYSIEPTI
jgi:peptide deformylase